MKEKNNLFFILTIFFSFFSSLAIAADENPLQTCWDCSLKVVNEDLFKTKDPSYKESLVIIKKDGRQNWKVNSNEDPAVIKARELEAKRKADLARKKEMAKQQKLKEQAELEKKRKLAALEEKRKKEEALKEAERKRLLAQKRARRKAKSRKTRREKIKSLSRGIIGSMGYAPVGSIQGTNLTAGYFWSKYSIEGSFLYNTEIVSPYNRHWNSFALTGKYYLKHQGAADYFRRTNYYGKVSLGFSSNSSSNSFATDTVFAGAGLGISHPIYHQIRVFGEIDTFFEDGGYHGESLTLGLKIRF